MDRNLLQNPLDSGLYSVFDLCLHPLGCINCQPLNEDIQRNMRGSFQGPAALWLMLR